jgi:DNA-binding beta-propeller fold protein YncE
LLLTATIKYKRSWLAWRASLEFDLLIVLTTLGAFFSAPIALLMLNPLWSKITGIPFVEMQTLGTQDITWSTGTSGIRLWGLFALFSVAAIALGLWWNKERWLKLAGIFMLITIPLFTTFFTNPAGLGTGFIGSLGYWLSQQGVARGSQPWYYYLIVFPFYEYLPLLGGILATGTFLVSRKIIPAAQRLFVLFLIWWAFWIFMALSLAGEKMPWLSTHIAIPFILLTAWWIGHIIQGLFTQENHARNWKMLAHSVLLSGTAILVIATIRASIAANFINYDYTTEFIDYAHGAPGVKWALNDIEAIANHTGAGRDLKIAYDDEVSWPMTWYLRNYRNQAFFAAEPNRQALDAPVVIAGPKNWNKVEAILGIRYHRFELIRLWWPMEEYKNLTWDRIRNAIINSSMRSALLDIFWNRDYQKYAEITGQPLNPQANWPLVERMRVYVRKDIAIQMLGMDIGSTMLEDLPTPIDTYEAIQKSKVPNQVITTANLNSPRGLAVAPDGSVYVADTGNSRIVHIDPNGNVLTNWGSRTPDGQLPPAPGTFIEPWGIAVDSLGNVYVADTWNHRVQKFNKDGKFLLEWSGYGQSTDNPLNLWGPRGIVVSPDGQVYVTDTGNKRVVVFDANGKFLQEFGTGGDGRLDEPVGIALSTDGQVYVADTWNSRVAIFSADGNFLNSWPVQGWIGDSLDNKPYIAVDAQGHVYITDPEKYRVIVFSSSGIPLTAFGQYGPEPDAFGLPVGIVAGIEGAIWVTDAGNNRLAKFDIRK